MNVLITGVCGFVGSTVARTLHELSSEITIVGMDNFSRPGSPSNITDLRDRGVKLFHGDVRIASDFETLPAVDWVIDSAANPSVIAGVRGGTSSRQLVEHNLLGTVNMLEFCKQHRAGFILLSTSRVYSIPPLAALPVAPKDGAFVPDVTQLMPPGITACGVAESFSTRAPVSLYGSTKLASETLALEYADTFSFPAFINRCGVMAGAGQFGRPDQGIFSYWIHSWARRSALTYIGFKGQGYQVRDCFHPADLASLLFAQMNANSSAVERIINVGGGIASARSLHQISDWCRERFGPHAVASEPTPRRFDIPWMVLDSSAAQELWKWKPTRTVDEIMEEIAAHAGSRTDWLDLSAPLSAG